MFDDKTRNLITEVPPLPQLERDTLPERLTSAFVEISSTRMLLSALNESDRIKITDRLIELRRLANTYASYVALGLFEEKTQSSAFVAGTAFRLLGEASTLHLSAAELNDDLSYDSVSDWLLAIVLFLIAGYPADSLATSKAMQLSSVPPKDRAASGLWRAIAAFGAGNLPGVIAVTEDISPTNVSENNGTGSLSTLAVELMWAHLCDGLRLLAAHLLGIAAPETANNESPQIVFSRVFNLATENFDVVLPLAPGVVAARTAYSAFAGPYWMAALLLRLTGFIDSRAVISTPAPPEVDENGWQEFLRTIAADRPFLWENHTEAIHDGYLNVGTSSVISFPTGAGKSTLAELKIGTHLIRGNKVIYVTPTHALAHQVRRALKRTFPSFDVRDSLVGDGYYSEVGEEGDAALSDITVMTPERCLMLMELYPKAFAEVGLFVLDECHLLHPSSGDHDRRALDTMLCLLRITDLANVTDVVLLSAMMANAVELASWLESILNRRCIALDIAWKPTRQARGCLVYPNAALKQLYELIHQSQSDPQRKTKGPPAKLKKQIKAPPLGLFCLRQNWITNANEDYKACLLSTDDMPIVLDQKWRLSTGKNDVAAKLAADLARQGIKTIVFSQNKKHCESIAKRIEDELKKTEPLLKLTSSEQILKAAAVREIGNSTNVYLPLPHGVVCHHRLLIPAERQLAEEVFRRADGAKVIVATPTLAQGMNLPAEAVILAGEYRFDQAHATTAMVAAHELLNAAGRAGRAGFHPEGVVLLIPDKPISFDASKYEIGQAWFRLKDSIFAKGDNCLAINDPIELLLDKLQISKDLNEGILAYFVNRLPVDLDAADSSLSPTERLLSRSLGAYRAHQSNTLAAFQNQIAVACDYRRRILQTDSDLSWTDRLAAANGVSSRAFDVIRTALDNVSKPVTLTVADWKNWLIDLMASDPVLAAELVRRDAVQAVLGKQLVPLPPTPWPKGTLSHVKQLCELWLKGETLVNIELEIARITKTTDRPYCTRARELSQGVALDLSFALGLVPQVWRATRSSEEMPTVLAVAGTCMRRGFASPEQLALSMTMKAMGDGEEYTRPSVHSLSARVAHLITGGSLEEHFADTRKRVDDALLILEMIDSLGSTS